MPTSESNWRMIHPSALVLGLVANFGQLVSIFILGFFLSKRGGSGDLVFILMIWVFLPLFGLLLRFLSFRYRLKDGNIEVQEGILTRKTRRIPVAKIQNINQSQSMMARLFNVVRLELETAAGANAEASFIALSPSRAEELKQFIYQFKPEKGAAEFELPHDKPLFQLSLSHILLTGATTSRMGLIMAFIYLIYQQFEEVVLRSLPNFINQFFASVHEMNSASLAQLIAYTLALIVVLVILSWIISIASAFIRYYQFSLSQFGTNLKIRQGLFTRREFTVPIPKMQAIYGKSTFIRRFLKLVQINAQTASLGNDQRQNRASSDVLTPLTRNEKVDWFIRLIWPHAAWNDANWKKVHPWNMVRHFNILFWWGMVGVTALYFRGWSMVTLVFLAIALAVLSFLIAFATFRQIAYATDGEHLYIRNGLIHLYYFFIPMEKVQSARVSQTFFQRRRALASISFDVAGTTRVLATIPNIPLVEAWSIFNQTVHTEHSSETTVDAAAAQARVVPAS